MEQIELIEKEAIEQVRQIVNIPWYKRLFSWFKKEDPTRGFKFALILPIAKIIIPSLIKILKSINEVKFQKLIGYLEQAMELLESI